MFLLLSLSLLSQCLVSEVLSLNATEYSRTSLDFGLYSSNGTRHLMNTTEYAAAYPMNSSEYSMPGLYDMYSSNGTRRLINNTEYAALHTL